MYAAYHAAVRCAAAAVLLLLTLGVGARSAEVSEERRSYAPAPANTCPHPPAGRIYFFSRFSGGGISTAQVNAKATAVRPGIKIYRHIETS